VAVALHLVNDVYGTGWGLPLLFPLTNNHYKFFSRKANLPARVLKERGLWTSLPSGETRVRLLVHWRKDELPAYILKYGLDDWIDLCYLQVTPMAVIEYSLFVVALVLTLGSLLY
jgi:hypothetical protein